jgi:uncharacterized protein with von Willebrand factor type A (vWA) domain
MIKRIGDVQVALAKEKYICDRALATAIFLGQSLEKPLLLEGKAGVGKTEGKKGDRLHTFNRKYASTVLYGKTEVIIISDGWDCGEEEVLRKEMARLRKYAHHVIWLNPLMGNLEYQPICRGMRTVLPYLDQFLPLFNLSSLTQPGQALEKVH